MILSPGFRLQNPIWQMGLGPLNPLCQDRLKHNLALLERGFHLIFSPPSEKVRIVFAKVHICMRVMYEELAIWFLPYGQGGRRYTKLPVSILGKLRRYTTLKFEPIHLARDRYSVQLFWKYGQQDWNTY